MVYILRNSREVETARQLRARRGIESILSFNKTDMHSIVYAVPSAHRNLFST